MIVRPILKVALFVFTAALLGATPARGDEPSPAAAESTSRSPGLTATEHSVQSRACASPRHAVEVFLHWTAPERFAGERAAQCFDLSLESDAAAGSIRARQLVEVLNARGLNLTAEATPSDSNHLDAQGEERFTPFPRQLPLLRVEKVNDRWLWSASSIAAIPDLHSETFAIDLRVFGDRLPQWAKGNLLGIEAWKLLGLLSVIVLAVFVRVLVMFFVAAHAKRLMGRLGAKWGSALLARIDNPIGTLAAAGVAALFIPSLLLPAQATLVGMLAVRVLAAFSGVWAVYRLVDVAGGWLEQRAARSDTSLEDQLVPLVRTSLKVFVVCVGVVFVLQNLDVDVAGLLAGLGLGGLAFALAARETIANLFGAVTVFLDKPFQIGDWIVVNGQDGIVEQVGFRSTRLRTFHNSVLNVPNSTIAGGIVDNYGARKYRRIFTTIGVTYDTTPEQMQAFVEGIRAVIKANPSTRKDFYEIHFNDFGDHALEVMVYLFVKADTWSKELQERHKVLLEILRLAKDLGIDFAFPTQTLHVKSMPEPGAVRPPRTGPENLAEVVTSFGPGGSRARPEGPRITDGFLPSQEKMEAKAKVTGGKPGSAAVGAGARLLDDD